MTGIHGGGFTVSLGDVISAGDLWLANVAEIRMDGETTDTAVRRAPQYLSTLSLSLELFVSARLIRDVFGRWRG